MNKRIWVALAAMMIAMTSIPGLGDVIPITPKIDFNGTIYNGDNTVGEGWTINLVNINKNENYQAGSRSDGTWDILDVEVDIGDIMKTTFTTPGGAEFYKYDFEIEITPFDIDEGRVTQLSRFLEKNTNLVADLGWAGNDDFSAVSFHYGLLGQQMNGFDDPEIDTYIGQNTDFQIHCSFFVSYEDATVLPNGFGLNEGQTYWMDNDFLWTVAQISPPENSERNQLPSYDYDNDVFEIYFKGAERTFEDPNDFYTVDFHELETGEDWKFTDQTYRLEVTVEIELWVHDAAPTGTLMYGGTLFIDIATVYFHISV